MRLLGFIFFLCFSATLFGQNARLAQQYFRDGEFEKAAVVYKQLFDKNQENDYYLERYIDCLIALEEYETCEEVLENELKRRPDKVNLFVTYGNLYERQFLEAEAEEQYQKAIDNLPKDRFTITKLANAFTRLTKYDLAIAAFEKGAKLIKDEYIFAYNLGDLYRRKGETPQMVKYFLISLDENPGRLNNLKNTFQRYLLADDDYDELKKQLYELIQKDGDAIHYPEMLTWVFIQQKDYKSAFRQVRALDRRLRENGGRVFQLAEIAANDGDYDAAIQAYEYIVERKGDISTFYLDAKREALRAKRLKLIEGYNYTMEELQNLEQEYKQFITEEGWNKTTAKIILELAELEALYINNLDEAIKILAEMITYPGINPNDLAYGKLNLADYYLMQGEIWEATLLYSQVDKAFKEDLLGHEARFRNAKLSYFAGEFQWAQAQFDVLKASTSKLIANDALDLSVFIMDNMGLDSTTTALKLFSEADLYVFQNRFDSAFLKLDVLLQSFPEHSLEDDVLYLKAKIYLKKKEVDKAVAAFQSIIETHGEEIRADNAIFELAELYENQLNEPEKAKELYETLFIDYSSSTFAVEARKRYRTLRGDNVQ